MKEEERKENRVNNEIRFYAGVTLSCLMMLPAFGCAKKTMETQKEKVGYSIGWDIGNNLKNQGIELNIDFLAEGLKDALGGSEPRLTDGERREVMQELSKKMQKKQSAVNGGLADKNKKEGADFLKANGKKKGVKTTSSGLQYRVIKNYTRALALAGLFVLLIAATRLASFFPSRLFRSKFRDKGH